MIFVVVGKKHTIRLEPMVMCVMKSGRVGGGQIWNIQQMVISFRQTALTFREMIFVVVRKKDTTRLELMGMCSVKLGKYVGDTFGTSGQTRCCCRDYDNAKKTSLLFFRFYAIMSSLMSPNSSSGD